LLFSCFLEQNPLNNLTSLDSNKLRIGASFGLSLCLGLAARGVALGP